MPNLLRRSLMRASMANSGPAEPKTSTAPVNRQSRSAASPRPPTCGAQPALLRVVAWHPVSVDVSIPELCWRPGGGIAHSGTLLPEQNPALLPASAAAVQAFGNASRMRPLGHSSAAARKHFSRARRWVCAPARAVPKARASLA